MVVAAMDLGLQLLVLLDETNRWILAIICTLPAGSERGQKCTIGNMHQFGEEGQCTLTPRVIAGRRHRHDS